MQCLLVVVALFLPRVTMFFIWILMDWFSRAIDTAMWPLLGFFFMPYTTLAYLAAMIANHHDLSGWWVALLILGVILDAGSNTAVTSGKE
jgi:hypothetical protein